MAAPLPLPYPPLLREERTMQRWGQQSDLLFYGLLGGVTLAVVLLAVGPGRGFLDCRAAGRGAWSCLLALLGLG
jgi:hypothetical protein